MSKNRKMKDKDAEKGKEMTDKRKEMKRRMKRKMPKKKNGQRNRRKGGRNVHLNIIKHLLGTGQTFRAIFSAICNKPYTYLTTYK